ncbi:MAG: YncE family protein [Candidatus Xenobia bacterium]
MAGLLCGCDLPYQKLFEVEHASPALPARIYAAVPEAGRVYAVRICDDSLTRQYPIAGRPVACAVSSQGTELAVLSYLTGMLTLLSLPGGELVARVPLEKNAEPVRVAYTADGGRLALLLRGTDSLLLLDRDRRQPLLQVKLDHHPHAMALSRDAKTAWVVSHEAGTLQIVDLEQGSVLKALPMGHDPYALALDPHEARLYVPCYTSDEVWVVDTASQEVAARIPLRGGPCAALCSAQGLVYVACSEAGAVHVLDAHQQTVLPQAAQLEPGVGSMTLSPLQDTLYVSVSTIPHLSVVSTDTLQPVARIPLDGKAQSLTTGN